MYTGTYPFRELKRCLSWSSVELLLCTWSKVNKDTTQLPLNAQKTAFFVSQTPCKIASFPGYWGGGTWERGYKGQTESCWIQDWDHPCTSWLNVLDVGGSNVGSVGSILLCNNTCELCGHVLCGCVCCSWLFAFPWKSTQVLQARLKNLASFPGLPTVQICRMAIKRLHLEGFVQHILLSLAGQTLTRESLACETTSCSGLTYKFCHG